MPSIALPTKIAIIGLGYVGLPLAVTFAKRYTVIGYDTNRSRIKELQSGYDYTNEVSEDIILDSQIVFTSNVEALKSCTVYIITVPTPIYLDKRPNLAHLLAASTTAGILLKKNDVVIYESTVYPGCTEEECVPVLEKVSGLQYNLDFFCGYSPERVNPGEKNRPINSIKKITSGSTPNTTLFVDKLYRSVIEAGTHVVSSIKVAEAAKVIENAQRDVNISFVNEVAQIMNFFNIDTTEVLEAAATKWNFLPFKPGLVGGHCIGVDPYYLTYKAESYGYTPNLLLTARKINEDMGTYIAKKIANLLIEKECKIVGCRVLLLGITFKENCPDIRNSKVIDIYTELSRIGALVDIYDPLAQSSDVQEKHGITLISQLIDIYDVVILAVAHDVFSSLSIQTLIHDRSIVYDLKSFFPRQLVNARL